MMLCIGGVGGVGCLRCTGLNHPAASLKHILVRSILGLPSAPVLGNVRRRTQCRTVTCRRDSLSVGRSFGPFRAEV